MLLLQWTIFLILQCWLVNAVVLQLVYIGYILLKFSPHCILQQNVLLCYYWPHLKWYQTQCNHKMHRKTQSSEHIRELRLNSSFVFKQCLAKEITLFPTTFSFSIIAQGFTLTFKSTCIIGQVENKFTWPRLKCASDFTV